MNIETGKIYFTEADIDGAKRRGEPLVKLSDADLRLLGIGLAKRKQARRRAKRRAAIK